MTPETHQIWCFYLQTNTATAHFIQKLIQNQTTSVSINIYFFVTQILKYYSSTYLWGKNSFSFLFLFTDFTVIQKEVDICVKYIRRQVTVYWTLWPQSADSSTEGKCLPNHNFFILKFLSAGISNSLCLINSIIHWDRKSNISVTTILQVRAVLYQHNGSRLFLIIE